MNIQNVAQIVPNLQAASLNQAIDIAVQKKVLDFQKLQGQAAIYLLESAQLPPSSDTMNGNIINVLA